MATEQDWIRVELDLVMVGEAEQRAARRAERARAAGRGGRLDAMVRAELAETAVRLYVGVDRTAAKVRSTDRPYAGLTVYDDEAGLVIFVSAHAGPSVLFLLGWGDAADLGEGARWKEGRRGRYGMVDMAALRPMPGRGGYAPQGLVWTIDPSTPFWCADGCKGYHPIGEHAACRAKAS